jgi:hypothetical protein
MKHPGKDPEGKSTAVPAPNVGPIEKEKTVPKSIRLWESAFDALKVLVGKYGKNMADMVSIAILAYAKQAAAAPIVRFRVIAEKTLFALQASATDIRTGLSNLRNDLYEARKSRRDPVELKLLYAELSANYQKILDHAEESLQKMDKELLLYKLLDPSDHALLVQLLDRLEQARPKNRSERQIRDLHLKIYRALIP